MSNEKISELQITSKDARQYRMVKLLFSLSCSHKEDLDLSKMSRYLLKVLNVFSEICIHLRGNALLEF